MPLMVSLAEATLGAVHVPGSVDHLVLQVAEGDLVKIHHPDGPHAGCRQILDHRGPQRAGADDDHLGGLDPLLSLDPDLPEHQVLAVPVDLPVVQGDRFSPLVGDDALCGRAAGNGREQQQGVFLLEDGVPLGLIRYVFLVPEQVHKGPQPAGFLKQGRTGFRILLLQVGQEVPDGFPLQLHLAVSVGKSAQGGGYVDRMLHSNPSCVVMVSDWTERLWGDTRSKLRMDRQPPPSTERMG